MQSSLLVRIGVASLLAACGSVRSTQSGESDIHSPPARHPEPAAQTSDELMYEISRREDAILAEIALLGPSHPWAGAYRLESKTVTERILVSPTAGCLATMHGVGLTDVNWGTATEAGGWLTIDFEEPQSAAHRFDEKYGLSGNGADRSLQVCGSEGVINWKLDRSLVPRREYGSASYWAPLRRSDLGVALRFERGSMLRSCFLDEESAWARYRGSETKSPHVMPLEPALARESGLQQLLPLAELNGWVVESNVAADLVLSLEDPRTRDLAGYARADLRAASRLCFVTAIQPAAKNPLFREFVLYRLDDTELVPLLHARIFVGVRGNLVRPSGWQRNDATQCQVVGVRNPIGIWSWNGGDSACAADVQLQPECQREARTTDEWLERPLVDWPHPLWVLFYWFEPK